MNYRGSGSHVCSNLYSHHQTLLQRALNHSWNEIFRVKVEVNVVTRSPFCGVLSWNLGSWLLDKRQIC